MIIGSYKGCPKLHIRGQYIVKCKSYRTAIEYTMENSIFHEQRSTLITYSQKS